MAPRRHTRRRRGKGFVSSAKKLYHKGRALFDRGRAIYTKLQPHIPAAMAAARNIEKAMGEAHGVYKAARGSGRKRCRRRRIGRGVAPAGV